MSYGVSVTIPEYLYRQAKEMARARHRSPDDIIAEILEQGLLPPPGPFAGDLDEEENEPLPTFYSRSPRLVDSA